MGNMIQRPLPGRMPVPIRVFVSALAADFDHFERHGSPMAADRFWERFA